MNREKVAALLREAVQLHGEAEGPQALTRALAAGDALNMAKALCPRGSWGAMLELTTIPRATANLYMRLARHRAEIEAAGCTSVREARELLTSPEAKAARPDAPRRRQKGARTPGADRDAVRAAFERGKAVGQAEGYAKGYERGERDGRRQARPTAARGRSAANLTSKQLLWLISLAHPDKNGNSAHATEVTQILNAMRSGM